jgi:8-oxo-dGTP pyrophosphatase MutT (NUDIX family)
MEVSYAVGRWCAAALLATADGRYVMQRRDDRPGLLLPDHWACFGGAVDPGEDGPAAMRRELREELELEAREVTLFTEITMRLPLPRGPRWDRMTFFLVPVADDEIARMVVHEGQGKRVFTPEALVLEAKVAPWDLCAILAHARERCLFPA